MRGEKLTTATDVYSLGVVLYELLTGARPLSFAGKSYEEVLRSINETEPQRPSKVITRDASHKQTNGEPEKYPKSKSHKLKSLSGDLDNIVLRALRKEPEQRYSSVEQFVADIDFHLADLPIRARPQTFGYRAAKYFKRHKIGVLAAALILISLIGGLSVAVWQAIEARRARARSEQRFNDVRVLANSLLFELDNSIKDLPGSTSARQLLTKRALEYLDKLAQEAQSDQKLQSELAVAYEKIGDVQGNPYISNLGDTSGALKSYHQALDIQKKLSAADPADRRADFAVATLHNKICGIAGMQNDVAEAEINSRQALGILERLTIADLDNDQYRSALSRTYRQLGEFLSAKNDRDIDGALANYQKSIAIDEKILAANPMSREALSNLQLAYRRVGEELESKNDTSAALQLYRQALAASEQMVAATPDNSTAKLVLAINHGKIGYVQATRGDLGDALTHSRKMLEICEDLTRSDARNTLAASQLALAYSNFGYIYLRGSDLSGAISSSRRALKIQEELRGKDATDVYNAGNLVETMITLGAAYEKQAASQNTLQDRHNLSLVEAGEWYQKGLNILLELKQNDRLPGYLADRLAELTAAVARCDRRH